MNSEKDIVNRIRSGDSHAMKDFYDLYAAYLSGVCSRYVADGDDQKDVFQDCIISIIQHIGEFEYRGNGSLKAWVTRIAINQALSFLRNKKRLNIVTLDDEKTDVEDDSTIETADIAPQVIHDIIKRLPEGYRAVFNLYVVEGKSHKEIAKLLGIKEMSSASQLHRAKAILAKEIEKYRKEKEKRA